MKKAFLQLHSAIILAACSGIFGKLISLNEILITWYRMLISAMILLLVFALSSQQTKFAKSDIKILFIGMLLALHWIFFYGSIKYANVSIGVVCFCLSGFFTAILSPIINKRKIFLSELLLSSLILIGISLIFHFDSSFRLGIIFGVISSFLFAIYAIVNEKINQISSTLKATTLQMLGGSIGVAVLMPFCFLFFLLQISFRRLL